MIDSSIKVNDITFDTAAGHPVSFQGKHARKPLQGIDLDFFVKSQNGVEKVERLLDQKTVQVDDPFAGRSYHASLSMISHSYQEGRPEHHYVCEIREKDIPPEFNILEIEGHQYSVTRYIETDLLDDGIDGYALLHLSQEQFIEIQRLFKPGAVSMRRVGVDEEPLTVRYAGGMYWSPHGEGTSRYYKQIVHFVPSDEPVSKRGVALGGEQEALVNMVYALSVRFEALVNELTQSNVISNERKMELFSEDWKGLLDVRRIDEIGWQTMKVPDAEEELD